MALELKHIVESNLIGVSYHCIAFTFTFKQLYTSCKTKHFSYNGGYGVRGHEHMHIKVFEKSWLRLQINSFMYLKTIIVLRS